MIRRTYGRVAAAAGWLARIGVRYGVGIAGGVCLTVGAALAHPAAGWGVAGLMLLALDRRVP